MSVFGFVKHAALGAGAMYFLDPVAGRRRRALARDKAKSLARQGECFLQTAGRDLKNRVAGLVAEGRQRFRAESIDDRRLSDRVRATLGHHVSHPAAISVQVRDGYVTLRGPVLEKDLGAVIRAVESTPGVQGVEDRLDVYGDARGVPALQGGASQSARTLWPPAARAAALGLGTAFMANCLRNMTLFNAALGTLGFGLFVRAVSNRPLEQIVAEQFGQFGQPEPSTTIGDRPAVSPAMDNPSFTSSRL